MAETNLIMAFNGYLEQFKKQFPDIIDIHPLMIDVCRVFYNAGYLKHQQEEIAAIAQSFSKEFIEHRCSWCDSLLGNTYFTNNDRLFCSEVCQEAAKVTHITPNWKEFSTDETTTDTSEWPELLQ